MEHGLLKVLMQPAEFIIILGSAIGGLVAANPLPALLRVVNALKGVLSGSPYTKKYYLDTLCLFYDLFTQARKSGTAKLEAHIDDPKQSEVFKKHPKFLKSHHAVDFFCDTMRVTVMGGVEPLDIDAMMEIDLEVHEREGHEPAAALTSLADSLPGLGIVAAVLGIVITMSALGGPKEVIGEKVAAALVGTFAGVLMCYGIVGPLAAAVSKQHDQEAVFFGVLRMGATGFVKKLSPLMAAEMARRAIPSAVRPTFNEMENACKGRGSAGGQEKKAA
jgi:chemotaxis protein MotA